MWGATSGHVLRTLSPSLFQSTRPVWGAPRAPHPPSRQLKLQSPRPVWGATAPTPASAACTVFQSTRPVWGATQRSVGVHRVAAISIHAPRVGRDRCHCGQRQRSVVISIHAPRVGRDAAILQSAAHRGGISIHAPRVGRDTAPSAICGMFAYFNPRAPCGARQERGRAGDVAAVISIHAPRVGRDRKFDDFTPSNLHKRYKRVLARPKNTREKGKIKQNLAYIHAFSAFLGCEGSGTFCALVLRTQYR